MHYLNQAINIFLLLIFSTSSFAGLGGEDDTWNADNADVNSCLVGRKGMDLNNAYYEKMDIAGELPFIRKYKTDLASNPYEIGRFYEDKHRSIGGWQNNYTNYLYLDKDLSSGSNDNIQLTLKLPDEDRESTYFHNLTTNETKKVVNFALSGDMSNDRHMTFPPMSSDGLYSIGYTKKLHNSDKIITASKKNGDIDTITVTSNGNMYILSKINISNTSSAKASKLYKITSIVYSNGTIHKFKYDEYGMLTNVDDSKGNHLEIFRDNRNFIYYVRLQKDGVKDYQNVSYKISSYSWSSINNVDSQRLNDQLALYRTPQFYILDEATTTLYGTEHYSYNNISEPFNNRYATSFDFAGGKSMFYDKASNAKGVAYIKELSPYKFLPLMSKITSNNDTILNFSYEKYNNEDDKFTRLKSTWKGYSPNISSESIITRHNDKFYDIQHNKSSGISFEGTKVSIDNNSTESDPISTKVSFEGYPCFTSGGYPIKSVVLDMKVSKPIELVDYKGEKYSYEYDDLARIIRSKLPNGNGYRETSYLYTNLNNGEKNNFNLPNTVFNDKESMTNTVDSNGNIVQKIHSDKSGKNSYRITSYKYETDRKSKSYGKILSMDSVKSNINDMISYSYDSYGNLNHIRKYIDDRELTERYSNFNVYGKPSTINDFNNVTTDIHYDSSGLRVVRYDYTSSSSSKSESYQYDIQGRNVKHINSDNEVTTWEYDTLSRVYKKISPTSIITTSYFPNNVIRSNSTSDLQGNLESGVTNGIDTWGRVAQNNILEGPWRQYQYDDNGNVIKETYPTAAGDSSTTYNYKGNYISSNFTDSWGSQSLKYDFFDNISTTSFGNSSNGSYDYDGFNQLSVQRLSDTGEQSLSYDTSGNIIKKSHSDRSCEYSGYDQLNRVKSIECKANDKNDYTKATTRNVYSQEGLGNLTGTFGSSTTLYQYDNWDRVIRKNSYSILGFKITNSSHGFVSTYGYTDGNKLSSIGYPSGRQVIYQYNSKGTVDSVLLDSKNLISNIKQDSLGRHLGWTWGSNNGQVSYSYSKSGALKSSKLINGSGKLIRDEEYLYYPNNLIKSKEVNSFVTQYNYNKSGYLINESMPSSSTNFDYDLNGNRINLYSTDSRYPFKQHSLSYIGGTNKISNSSTDKGLLKHSYNQTGEMVLLENLTTNPELDASYGFVSANYDAVGRRVFESTVTRGVTVHPARQIEYNHKNERVARLSHANDPMNRFYAYDEDSHLIGEYDVNNNPIVEYVWLGNRPIASIYPNGDVMYIKTDNKGTPEVGYSEKDWSTRFIWGHDAFGVGIVLNHPEFVMNLRYPGQVYDEITKLHYNHHRYYNPLLGRYMEPDPIGLEGGDNPYIYANNDPVNLVDTSGLASGVYYDKSPSFKVPSYYLKNQHSSEMLGKPIYIHSDTITRTRSDWLDPIQFNKDVFTAAKAAVSFSVLRSLNASGIIGSVTTGITLSRANLTMQYEYYYADVSDWHGRVYSRFPLEDAIDFNYTDNRRRELIKLSYRERVTYGNPGSYNYLNYESSWYDLAPFSMDLKDFSNGFPTYDKY